MLQFEEQKLRLSAARPELDDLGEALDISDAKNEITRLEEQAAGDGFWDDLENSQKVLRQTSKLKNKVSTGCLKPLRT